MEWTEERVETLKGLWKNGYTARQISERLDGVFSRNAVIGKAHRMGLVEKKEVIKRDTLRAENRIKFTPRPLSPHLVDSTPPNLNRDAANEFLGKLVNGGRREYASMVLGSAFLEEFPKTFQQYRQALCDLNESGGLRPTNYDEDYKLEVEARNKGLLKSVRVELDRIADTDLDGFNWLNNFHFVQDHLTFANRRMIPGENRKRVPLYDMKDVPAYLILPEPMDTICLRPPRSMPWVPYG